MKNLDKTLWIKRIFMVLMDICIVILTSITALIVRFEFSLSAVPKYYIGVVWSSLPATLVIAFVQQPLGICRGNRIIVSCSSMYCRYAAQYSDDSSELQRSGVSTAQKLVFYLWNTIIGIYVYQPLFLPCSQNFFWKKSG